MPNFIIAYHGGGTPATPEDGARYMEKWKVWVSDIGDAIVSPATPLGKSTFLTSDGIVDGNSHQAMAGYLIVSADSMDAAIEIAKGGPFLDMDNAMVQIAELKKMG